MGAGKDGHGVTALCAATIGLSPFSADPANGGLLGYVLSTSPNDILVVANSEEKEFILITAPHSSAPAFSTTGEQVAYINQEVGSGAGLYVVAAKESAKPKEILADPAPPKTTFEAGSFHQLTWAGPNIVFSAVVGGVQNIYSLAAHCVTDPSPCTMPTGATQLPSGATSKTPDQFPTWTSATIAGLAATTGTTTGAGTTGGGGTGGGTTGGGGAPTVGSSSVTHAKVKGLGATVTLACAGAAGRTCVDSLTLSVLETLRLGKLVAVAARTTKRTVTLGRASVTVAADQVRDGLPEQCRKGTAQEPEYAPPEADPHPEQRRQDERRKDDHADVHPATPGPSLARDVARSRAPYLITLTRSTWTVVAATEDCDAPGGSQLCMQVSWLAGWLQLVVKPSGYSTWLGSVPLLNE